MTRNCIRHRPRYRRRWKSLLSFAVKFLVEIALGSFPSETVTRDHTSPVAKSIVELDPRISDRLACRYDPEVRERIQPQQRFAIEMLSLVEATNLGCVLESDVRNVGLRDLADAGSPGAHGSPKLRRVVSQAGDNTDARDYYSFHYLLFEPDIQDEVSSCIFFSCCFV